LNEELKKVLEEIVRTQNEELKKDISEQLQVFQNGLNDQLSAINDKLEILTDMVREHEGQNGNRHLELEKKIKVLKEDVSVVEVVSSKNSLDIAHLKAVINQ